ncbi:MAG: hypothetical protein ACRD4J_14175 [Nitrososphaeraceae archaeon]|jgi:hypothetical protein
MMPSQNLYRQHTDTELTSASSTAEEDLERKIDAITTYQKPYIKSIFIRIGARQTIKVIPEVTMDTISLFLD